MKFNEMNTVQQLKELENILDKEIRHFLHQDGGDCQIIEIKTKEEKTNVYIRYQGACSGCGGASGTLFAIQGIFNEKLDENIEVHSI